MHTSHHLKEIHKRGNFFYEIHTSWNWSYRIGTHLQIQYQTSHDIQITGTRNLHVITVKHGENKDWETHIGEHPVQTLPLLIRERRKSILDNLKTTQVHEPVHFQQHKTTGESNPQEGSVLPPTTPAPRESAAAKRGGNGSRGREGGGPTNLPRGSSRWGCTWWSSWTTSGGRSISRPRRDPSTADSGEVEMAERLRLSNWKSGGENGVCFNSGGKAKWTRWAGPRWAQIGVSLPFAGAVSQRLWWLVLEGDWKFIWNRIEWKIVHMWNRWWNFVPTPIGF
jgi:hypothetical protein